MNARTTVTALLLTVSFGLVGCGGAGGGASGGASSGGSFLAPLSIERKAAVATQFVGYWDGWQSSNLTDTPTGITEIPIAFGYLRGHTITDNGEINAGYVTAADIAALHARGIKVTLSLGGWSPSTSFTFDGDVKGFEQSLTTLRATVPFDGIDFDMEHGTTAARVKALETLIPATRTYFKSLGITDAIVTYTGWPTPTDYGDDEILKDTKVINSLSWVNVMSYQNNNVAATESDVAAYGAIFDKSRIMMGVDIVDAPIPTDASLQALAAWVKTNGYGGMMGWTVNTITTGQLDAITGQ